MRSETKQALALAAFLGGFLALAACCPAFREALKAQRPDQYRSLFGGFDFDAGEFTAREPARAARPRMRRLRDWFGRRDGVIVVELRGLRFVVEDTLFWRLVSRLRFTHGVVLRWLYWGLK